MDIHWGMLSEITSENSVAIRALFWRLDQQNRSNITQNIENFVKSVRRGRGRGRGRASSAAVQGSANWKTGYNHEDLFRPSVKFSPQRPPGHHLNE